MINKTNNTNTPKHKRILTATAVVVVLAAVAIALVFARMPESEAVSYKEKTVEAVTMEQTLTAAGELKAAATEDIAFSTSKTFSGMCVEEGDAVREGQHLISYSDGTYTDAPDNGVVDSIDAPQTGSAADEDNMITLAYTDQMILEISVPEDEISNISKGNEAMITINADTSKTFNGTISSLKAMSSTQLANISSQDSEDTDTANAGSTTSNDSTNASTTSSANTANAGSTTSNDSANAGTTSSIGGANAVSGTASGSDSSSRSSGTAYYNVAMTLTNDGTLKAGMSGSCTITISSRKSVLAVPIEAVQFDEDDTAYVELVEDGTVTKKNVTTGESDANYVEITDGLSEGETVRVRVIQ